MCTRMYNVDEIHCVLNLMYNGNGIHCIVNLVPLPEGRLMSRGRHVLIRSIACERPSGVHTTLTIQISQLISPLLLHLLHPYFSLLTSHRTHPDIHNILHLHLSLCVFGDDLDHLFTPCRADGYEHPPRAIELC